MTQRAALPLVSLDVAADTKVKDNHSVDLSCLGGSSRAARLYTVPSFSLETRCIVMPCVDTITMNSSEFPHNKEQIE